jgi:hypothetical protein
MKTVTVKEKERVRKVAADEEEIDMKSYKMNQL